MGCFSLFNETLAGMSYQAFPLLRGCPKGGGLRSRDLLHRKRGILNETNLTALVHLQIHRPFLVLGESGLYKCQGMSSCYRNSPRLL